MIMKRIKAHRYALSLFIVLICQTFLVNAFSKMNGAASFATTNFDAQGTRKEVELMVYFTNPNLPEWANTCGAGEFVKRKTLVTKRPADAALRLLFAGPTDAEKAKGMESLAPLGDYYLGVSIKRGVATVNFKPGAEKYLYVLGPNCRQEQVLTPIANTLKRFPSIKKVDYAINGKVIEEWDA